MAFTLTRNFKVHFQWHWDEIMPWYYVMILWVVCSFHFGPFVILLKDERFFHRNPNSTEILFCSLPSYSKVIVVKCCKWYDSCTVVAAYAKCSVMIPYDGVTPIPIFRRIWITMEKSFVKWPLLYEYWFIFSIYLYSRSIEKHATFPTLVKVRHHVYIHLQKRENIYFSTLQCLLYRNIQW